MVPSWLSQDQVSRSARQKIANPTAEQLLGNPDYPAICYGGYRTNTREVQPTVAQLKEDIKILSALGIKFLRTYNVHYAETENLLKAIAELKQEDSSLEMYVMLGIWIDCENAFTNLPRNHFEESPRNAVEVEEAVRLANLHSETVKVLAVGNEAMVKWATSYYVHPHIVLKWVNHLQALKQKNLLDKDLWITSSDNFAAWGGGDNSYHVEDLVKLCHAVDYLSVHTYPMHDTHYHPVFWGVMPHEEHLSVEEKIDALMRRSLDYAKGQYRSVQNYLRSIGVDKPIHIGETGWATRSEGLYGTHGSKACDEYKSGIFYRLMREWTDSENISCFYFEAFNESWKDSAKEGGSENHFGLFSIQAQARYAIWDKVDQGVFAGLSRDGHAVEKSHGGDKALLLESIEVPGTLRL